MIPEESVGAVIVRAQSHFAFSLQPVSLRRHCHVPYTLCHRPDPSQSLVHYLCQCHTHTPPYPPARCCAQYMSVSIISVPMYCAVVVSLYCPSHCFVSMSNPLSCALFVSMSDPLSCAFFVSMSNPLSCALFVSMSDPLSCALFVSMSNPLSCALFVSMSNPLSCALFVSLSDPLSCALFVLMSDPCIVHSLCQCPTPCIVHCSCQCPTPSVYCALFVSVSDPLSVLCTLCVKVLPPFGFCNLWVKCQFPSHCLVDTLCLCQCPSNCLVHSLHCLSHRGRQSWVHFVWIVLCMLSVAVLCTLSVDSLVYAFCGRQSLVHFLWIVLCMVSVADSLGSTFCRQPWKTAVYALTAFVWLHGWIYK